MRFFLYCTVLFAILPLVFMRPFFGLCVYYVVSLLQPKYLCWRNDFQDALLVGLPLVVGAVAIGVQRLVLEPVQDPQTGKIVDVIRRQVRGPLFEWRWPLICMLLLVIYIAVARLIVPYPMHHTSDQFRSVCKVVLVAALLTGMACELRRFRTLYIVVALATAFWAIKGGFKVILLGPHQVYGKNYDNNLFALVSVMALPLVFYFAMSVKHTRWRALLLCCAALICLGIIGSRSRAGFVAFAVVLACMAWTSRYRIRAFVAVAMVATVVFLMSGKEIQERIVSIVEYREDRSALSRFTTWQAAQRLLWQHPVFGVGFNNFERAKDREVGGQKAAHNVFLQNAAELGLLGHPLWLAVVVGTIFSLYRLMRRCRRLPPDMRWGYYWSRGLMLGMLAFCVHGFFHNEEYLEFMFVLVGLNVALHTVVSREVWHRSLLTVVEQARQAREAEADRARLPEAESLLFTRPRPRHRPAAVAAGNLC